MAFGGDKQALLEALSLQDRAKPAQTSDQPDPRQQQVQEILQRSAAGVTPEELEQANLKLAAWIEKRKAQRGW